MLDHATALAAMGWGVFPIRPRDKRPLTPNGVKDAVCDEATIKKWWSKWPDANLGVACGAVSGGLFVVDVDGPEGEAALADLEREHGALPETIEAKTARGRHLFFRSTDPLPNSASKLGPKIDTRGEGGYVVAPPSVHPAGAEYEWILGPLDLDLAPLPGWVAGLLRAPLAADNTTRTYTAAPERLERYAESALRAEVDAVTQAPSGGRNDALNRAAFNLGQLVGGGVLHRDVVVADLVGACARNGLLREGRRAVDATIASGLRAGEAHPRGVPESDEEIRRMTAEAPAPVFDDLAPMPATRADPGASTFDSVLDEWEASGPLVHEPTGLDALDAATRGGPCYGERWYVQGAPDAGKTALLVQIAHAYAERGITVGLLAVDEEPGDLVTRFAQRLGFERDACDVRDPGAIATMRRRLAELPVRFYGAGWTIEGAAADIAERAAPTGGRGFLGVDSIQTVRCNAELHAEREMSMTGAIEARVRAVRAVASEHRLIAVSTSEMGREGYRGRTRGERIDPLAASKWSGAIEYSARVLVSLTSVPKVPDIVELELAKNKHGRRRLATEGAALYLRVDRPRQTLTETTAPAADEQSPEELEEREAARVEEMAEKILGALVKTNAKGGSCTSRLDLQALVRGTRTTKSAAVSLLLTEGRIEGGRGQPFTPRYGDAEAAE